MRCIQTFDSYCTDAHELSESEAMSFHCESLQIVFVFFLTLPLTFCPPSMSFFLTLCPVYTRILLFRDEMKETKATIENTNTACVCVCCVCVCVCCVCVCVCVCVRERGRERERRSRGERERDREREWALSLSLFSLSSPLSLSLSPLPSSRAFSSLYRFSISS